MTKNYRVEFGTENKPGRVHDFFAIVSVQDPPIGYGELAGDMNRDQQLDLGRMSSFPHVDPEDVRGLFELSITAARLMGAEAIIGSISRDDDKIAAIARSAFGRSTVRQFSKRDDFTLLHTIDVDMPEPRWRGTPRVEDF